MLFFSILLLVHRRSAGRDRAAVIDALLFATAATLSSWVFLIQPVLDVSSLAVGQILVTAALLELGYRLGQGFLMARPMPAEAMRTQLGEQAAAALGTSVS